MAASAPATELEKATWNQTEQLVKLLPGVVAAIYSAGFIVVAAHHALYGIPAFDLLRSRILTAGCLVAVLTAYPIVVFFAGWHWTLQYMTSRKASERIVRFHRGVNLTIQPLAWVASCLAFLRLDTVGLIFGWGLQIVICCVCFKLIEPYAKPFVTRQAASQAYLAMGVILAFCTITANFGYFFYGKLGVYLGGGRPEAIILHVLHPTSFCKDDCAAFLVDEVERGYYLSQTDNARVAVFVPREAVASIDFQRAGVLLRLPRLLRP